VHSGAIPTFDGYLDHPPEEMMVEPWSPWGIFQTSGGQGPEEEDKGVNTEHHR
jgi:hypothetical protein